MALSDAQVRRLVTRYQTRIADLGEGQAQIVVRRWLEVGPSFDDVDRFRFLVAPQMATTKTTAVRLADGLYSLLLGARGPAVDPNSIEVPDEIREPFIAYWRAINNGASQPEALKSGAARAEAITRNLAVSSGRRTGDAVARRGDRDIQWRRMTDGDACNWCVDLTSHVWPSSEAADFGHDRCGCTPIPA